METFTSFIDFRLHFIQTAKSLIDRCLQNYYFFTFIKSLVLSIQSSWNGFINIDTLTDSHKLRKCNVLEILPFYTDDIK